MTPKPKFPASLGLDQKCGLGKPLVVVVDALDEAKAPDAIAEVLRNLAMAPRVKLLPTPHPF